MSKQHNSENRIRGDFRVIRLNHDLWQVSFRHFLTGIQFPVATDLTAEDAKMLKEVLNQTLFDMFPRTPSTETNGSKTQQVTTVGETKVSYEGSVEEE